MRSPARARPSSWNRVSARSRPIRLLERPCSSSRAPLTLSYRYRPDAPTTACTVLALRAVSALLLRFAAAFINSLRADASTALLATSAAGLTACRLVLISHGA